MNDLLEVGAPDAAPSLHRSVATDALFVRVYDELCRLARREVWRLGANDFLNPVTLVHEVWLAMSGSTELSFDAPRQLLAYASRAMRGIIVDHIRARTAKKRGGDVETISFDLSGADDIAQPEPIEAVSEALECLEEQDPMLAQVVNLKFFGGFSFTEIAAIHGVTERTVQRHWERARLLLQRELS